MAHHLQDDLWAIPTAEVPLASMVAGEVLDESELPMRLRPQLLSPRGRVGGRHPGSLRHEFDEVDSAPLRARSGAGDAHGDPRAGRGAIRDLGLAHRVLDLACGDISGAGARTYDIEVFCQAPTVGSRSVPSAGARTIRPGGQHPVPA